jgi:hypothetical protein
MPETTTIVGHITELYHATDLVEIEAPHGNDEWKTRTVPKSMLDGHAEMELGEHVAVEIRDYGKFAVGESRPVTDKEEQWLRQRFARHDAKLKRSLEKLDDDLFTKPESL